MANMPQQPPLRTTAATLAVGGIGAAIASILSVPAALLLGPALCVSCAAVGGLRMQLPERLRDVCFVILGLSIGSGFSAEAGSAVLRWPLAFVAIFVTLVLIMTSGRLILQHLFGFDRRSAVLATAPGHLSFVMGLAADTGGDVARIGIVQSIRLLALTVAVPFVALALGYQIGPITLPQAQIGAALPLLAMGLVGTGVGAALKRTRMPAPLLMGPFIVSALAHVTDIVPGALPPWLILPAFVVLGTLIGTRFSGISFAMFRAALLAGLTYTFVSMLIAGFAAFLVAGWVQMPTAHVLVAFAPGGVETMIALGAAMQASPGFVAACHIIRLLILTVLIPWFVGRDAPAPAN